MHVTLELPEGWGLRKTAGGFTALSPAGASGALVVMVSPLYGRATVDLPALLGVESPPLTRWVHRQSVDATTVTGWPMELITATVHDTRDVVETRLAAVYTFVHWTGCAVAISRDAERYEDDRPLLLRLLASARPDLRTTAPACLHELWDMSVDDAGPSR